MKTFNTKTLCLVALVSASSMFAMEQNNQPSALLAMEQNNQPSALYKNSAYYVAYTSPTIQSGAQYNPTTTGTLYASNSFYIASTSTAAKK